MDQIKANIINSVRKVNMNRNKIIKPCFIQKTLGKKKSLSKIQER